MVTIATYTNPAPPAQDYPRAAAGFLIQQAKDESAEHCRPASIDMGKGRIITVGYSAPGWWSIELWDCGKTFARSGRPWLNISESEAIDLLADNIEQGCIDNGDVTA